MTTRKGAQIWLSDEVGTFFKFVVTVYYLVMASTRFLQNLIVLLPLLPFLSLSFSFNSREIYQ